MVSAIITKISTGSMFQSALVVLVLGMLVLLPSRAFAQSKTFALICKPNPGVVTATASGEVTCYVNNTKEVVSISAICSSASTCSKNATTVVVTVDCGSGVNVAKYKKGQNITNDKLQCHTSKTPTITVKGGTATPTTTSVTGLSGISPDGLPQPHADTASLQTILQIVFGALGGLAVLMITISGLRYVVSAGNPERITKAKNGIIYSMVGLAVALSAEAIVAFVGNRL